MPDLNGWELSALCTRLIFYFALLSAVGGTFSLFLIPDDSRRFLQRNLLWVLIAALLGFDAVLVYFLIQIGSVNQTGLAGMLDWDLIAFYLQLEIGDASLIRLGGFLLLLMGQLSILVHISRLTRPPRRRVLQSLMVYNLLCLAPIIYSFTLTGHIAVQPLPSRLGLILHVTAMSLWLGSLWPLWKLAGEADLVSLQLTMRRFSDLANLFVGVLILSALLMLWQLFDSPTELVRTPYGRLLLLKIGFVLLLLGMAALNKWRLAPALGSNKATSRLRRSIALEVLLGLVILTITAGLSTLIGPGEH